MPGQAKFDTAPLTAALNRLRREEVTVRRRALLLGAEAIVGEAQQPGVVPFKTGALAASHTVDDTNPDLIVLGANIEYGAVVHEVHPTKSQWFLKVMLQRGANIMRKALTKALEESHG